ncbi:Protein of unknown function [Pseudonocardia thermophila]|jgi:Protein of unknown function (DUF3073).|uniref:DUF3073 domain-containing protein n=1 Tax=Pseudonocardia thermophila TaxID=1848 RepID=A0A1M6SBV6_PSETH|nr:DUF3073 domain-containing protein [Pseudonocardia thermophila]SHK42211.1 Protein of unknown function [Pseudonocardia thermophila]
MGRGRAKAKQTKVARELKYSTPKMDLDALQRELSSSGSVLRQDETGDEYDDPYAPADYEDDSNSNRR